MLIYPKAIFFVLLLLCSNAIGCLSPTLPLPPPEDVSVSPPDVNGMVAVAGQVRDEAYVNCINERTESGVIVKSSEFGHFDLQIAAQVNDTLTLWQTLGSDTGGFISKEVPEAPPTEQTDMSITNMTDN